MALIKRMTVAELFLKTIEKSHNEMQDDGSIEKNDSKTEERKDKLIRIMF